MISLAITTFNRNLFVIEAFIKVIDNDLIDEIIIVDDHSDEAIFIRLNNIIVNLGKDKVKLYRNETNLKPFANKYEAVKKCRNEWVILLDSDNIIDNNYIKTISAIEKEDDVIYCPEILYRPDRGCVEWTYGEFNGLVIDKTNVKNYLNNINFETLLNTGNYFLNREKYMSVFEQSDKDNKWTLADSVYFSYLWLLGGNRMKIIPDLYYTHRIHGGSWYLMNFEEYSFFNIEIKEKIKEL